MALNLETLQIQFEIRDNTGSKLKKLQKQLAGMEDPEIDVNTQEAEKKIKELQKTAEDLEIEAEIDADTKGAKKKIDDLEKEAKNIGGATVEIGGDKSGFDAVLKTVQGAAENINAGSADIGGDKSGFETVANSVAGSADDIDAGAADIGGDKSSFDDVAASVKGAAENIDAGNADIGGDKSGFETVIATVKGAADDIDAGSADIGGNKSGFDTVLQTIKGAAENINAGSADIGGDKSGFESVKASVEGAADGIDAGDADIGGDKSAFTVVISTLKGSADGIDAGSANIGGDKSGFESVAATIKGAADGIDAGSANIGGDKSGFDSTVASVRISVGNLPGGSVTISGFAEDALDALGDVIGKINDIPKNPTTTPEVETSTFSKGMATIRKLLIGSGLLAFGKGAYEFSMQALDESYGAQAVQNQIENLGGQTALDKIGEFTAEMNEKYELNESGLAEMAKNFSAVFKGAGMETEAALDKGIEMARYAIDYASALDKTPGEIADIFMSVLKGNTEVADSASIYGLTADVMDTKITEMTGLASMQEKLENVTGTEAEALSSQIDTLNADIEKNKSLYKALAFFDIMKENADVKMGFTGDWERTFEEFGNQKTVLGEQFKTLQQNAGEILLPAASTIVSGLNDIISAVTSFTENLGKSTFAKDVDGYFGTMTVDETTMNNAISHVTEPINKMTTALDNANASLKTATDSMSASYEAFLKVLLVSNTDGDLSNDMDKIEHAGEELANDAIFTVTAGRINLIERLNIFTGGLLEAETNAMYSIVDSYFDQAEEKVKQRKKEFDEAVAALKKENTPENLQQVKDKAFSMMQEAYTLSAGYIGSDEYDWLRSTYKSGQLSADTISQWMKGMNDASSEEQAKLRGEYEKARRDFVAIGQQVLNEKTGALYTPGELNEIFGADAGEYTHGKENEAKSRRLGFISELLLGEYGSATADIYDRLYNGKITGEEAATQITTMVKQLEGSGLIYELYTLENRTPAMEKLLNLEYGLRKLRNDHLPTTNEILNGEASVTGIYEHAMVEYFGTGAFDQILRDAELAVLYSTLKETGFSDNPFYNPQKPAISSDGSAEFWKDAINLFPDIGDYVPNASAYIDSGINENALSSFTGDLSSALESIPDKIVVESHVYVGGYELGKATEEATITYNTSTGSGNN